MHNWREKRMKKYFKPEVELTYLGFEPTMAATVSGIGDIDPNKADMNLDLGELLKP